MTHFMRYFLACVGALILDYGVSALALELGYPYYWAIMAGAVLGAITGFVLLSFWVFPSQKDQLSKRRILGYASSLGLVYVIRTMTMYVWYKLAGTDASAHIGLFFAYGTSFTTNYLYQKFFVFAQK